MGRASHTHTEWSRRETGEDNEETLVDVLCFRFLFPYVDAQKFHEQNWPASTIDFLLQNSIPIHY